MKDKFTRADIRAELQAAGADPAIVRDLTNRVIAVLAAAIAAGKVVELRGLGTFEPREHKPYRAHNPRSLAVVDVPARRSVFFKPCGALKAAMNGQGGPDEY